MIRRKIRKNTKTTTTSNTEPEINADNDHENHGDNRDDENHVEVSEKVTANFKLYNDNNFNADDDDDEEEIEIKDEIKPTNKNESKSNKNESKSKEYSSKSSNKSSNKNSCPTNNKTPLKESVTKKRENSDKDSNSSKKLKSSDKPKESYKKHSNDDSDYRKSESDKDKDYDEAYFKRMNHRGQDHFHDPTDKELFIENLMNNIKDKEIKLCKYRHSASCIIWLIKNIDDKLLKKITEKFVVQQFTMSFVSDLHSRAVLHTIVDVFIKKLSHETNWELDSSKWMIKWIDSVAEFVIENLNSMLTQDTQESNHLLITILEALGGIRIGCNWNRKNMRFGRTYNIDLKTIISNYMVFNEIPQSFKHHLKKITKALVLDSSDDNIREILFARCTNVSQYLLFILRVRYPQLCQMAVKKLVEVVFANETNRDSICQTIHGAYIVEIILLVASESRLSKIWTKHIKNNLKAFWKHDISQFIIQRLIHAIKEENLFADVVQDLLPDLSDIIKCKSPGIVVCLAKTCQDHLKLQTSFFSALLKAFDCHDPKDKYLDLVPQLLFFESEFPKLRSYHYQMSIWLFGSLILQHMFNYDNPYKLSKSLLSMSISDLLRTCQDPSGSHVIDSLLRSTTVEMKHKSELVERLLGNYCTLACNKYGSRIVDEIMELSNEEVRTTIMDELSHNEALLKNNRNGWFVSKNVGLYHYKNRPNDWRDVERNRMKRKREFDNFISIKHRNSFGGDRRERRFRPRF